MYEWKCSLKVHGTKRVFERLGNRVNKSWKYKNESRGLKVWRQPKLKEIICKASIKIGHNVYKVSCQSSNEFIVLFINFVQWDWLEVSWPTFSIISKLAYKTIKILSDPQAQFILTDPDRRLARSIDRLALNTNELFIPSSCSYNNMCFGHKLICNIF